MTDSTKTTEQQQSSTTSPWSAAMPLVNNLLGQYGNANTGVTGDQSSALSNLLSSTQGLPNFTGAATGAINNLFGTNNSGGIGMLQGAYGTQQNNLGALADPANLNPLNTPGLSDALKTMTSDITNQVKGVYAGSGRDPSGAGSFAQSLGRGLTQGEAPVLASQYNSNVGNLFNANNALMSGASNTASGINSLQQQQLTNALLGINAAGSIPGLATGGALAQLGAANAGYSQPYSNLAALLQPSIALAGLGSQSTGQGTSTSTSTPSLLDSITSGTKLAGSLFSGAGSAASLLPLLSFSDILVKSHVHKVGKLHDGQNVYGFKYKGSDKPQIGLIAQEVEQHVPDAVVTEPKTGLKMVDYGKALAPSAAVGALKRAA